MLLHIKSLYGTLTDAEKKVAGVVVNDPVGVTKQSAKEVADRAAVAPSAVIRFCKKAGVSGLKELKEALIEELIRDESTALQMLPVSQDDTLENIFRKTFQFGAHALQNTLKMLNFDELETITQKIVSANRVVFFGVGTSSVVAMDAHYRFSQLGISSSFCSDILFMNVTAANLSKEDLAIFISHSGQTRATVDSMRKAKEVNATTVAISSYAHSLLAQECDHRIIAFSDAVNYPVEAVSAGIAHMCIVDSLMMAIAKTKNKALGAYMEARNEALKHIRY